MAPAHAQTGAAPRRLVTTFWRMIGPSQRQVACALYRTDAGLELWVGYDLEGVVVRTTHVVSEGAATIVAAEWKAATMAVARFRDLNPPASRRSVRVPALR